MRNHHLFSVLLALSLSVLCHPVEAHDLDVSTARITLRDGHVEVLAELDMLSLLSNPGDQGATLTALAAAPEAALAGRLAEAREALERESSVESDAGAVPLVLRMFPTPAQVRATAAAASTESPRHRPTLKLRLEATRPVRAAPSVSVRLPASAGPVLYTFAQPAVSLASPGAAASFVVLTPPGSPAPAAAPATVVSLARPWFGHAAGLLAAIAIAVQVLPLLGGRRRDRERRQGVGEVSP
jgi:hypothetical protein